MKEAVSYWLKAHDPAGNIIWERPVLAIPEHDESGREVRLKVVDQPEGGPPPGTYTITWELAWQVVETRPEKLIPKTENG